MMVEYGVGIIEESGYIGENITFKSDQEPSVVALKNAIAAATVGETVPIESPVRASKSNGMMEMRLRFGRDNCEHAMLNRNLENALSMGALY